MPFRVWSEVDDVDPVALAQDEAAHLRVPSAGLVAEMHAGLQQLPRRDDGHGCSSHRLFFPGRCAPAGGDRGRGRVLVRCRSDAPPDGGTTMVVRRGRTASTRAVRRRRPAVDAGQRGQPVAATLGRAARPPERRPRPAGRVRRPRAGRSAWPAAGARPWCGSGRPGSRSPRGSRRSRPGSDLRSSRGTAPSSPGRRSA